MKIICISDTHGKHDKIDIPDGDMLLHAGDITSSGEAHEIVAFNKWLGTLPHRHKIVIAGNHDFYFENYPSKAKSLITNALYLNDEGVEIENLKIWGSPVQPWFYNWAFNRRRGSDIKRHWDLIPTDTDILITHGPPYKILDKTVRGDFVGCEDLLEKVNIVKPRLHLFGHIHEAYGQTKIGETLFINASSLNLNYQPMHKASTIEIM